MKTALIFISLGLLCLFGSKTHAQNTIYPDHQQAWNYSVFLSNSGLGGGGSVSLDVSDDILKIVFSASFSSSTLKQGKVVQIQMSPNLPDLELGNLVSNYSVGIEEGWLTIENSSGNYDFVNSLNRTIEYNLRNYHTSYIKTYTPTFNLGSNIFDPNIPQHLRDRTQEDISFFDGLGRPIQQIQVAADATGTRDIVSFNVYDGFGRESWQYLPFSAGSSKASHFYADPLSLQQQFYEETNGDGEGNFAFSRQFYDNSINNRITKTRNPGIEWNAGTFKEIDYVTRLNNPNELVKLNYNQSNDEIIYNGFYDENELLVKEIEDQNKGNNRSHVLEFYDFNEKLIARKTKYQTAYNTTYFIYDGLERQKFIIQPEGFERVLFNWSDLNDPGFRDKWIFKYEYDKYDRIITKKIPGRDAEHFVYDTQDRIVMSQDGNQRQHGNWTIFAFDKNSRMVMQGERNFNLSRSQIQSFIDNSISNGNSPLYETRQPGLTGYSTNSYQSHYANIDWINYYDDYDFNGDGAADYQYIADPQGSIPIPTGLKNTPLALLTGEVYSNTANSQEKRVLVRFYNELNQVVQTQEMYKIEGSAFMDVTFYQYNFQGNIIKNKTIHRYMTPGQIVLAKHYDFDHRGRLLNAFYKVNSDPEITLCRNEYNAKGELKRQSLHSPDGTSFLQNVDYRYNIRGWLESINTIDYGETIGNEDPHNRYKPTLNSDLFALELDYVLSEESNLTSTSQYNGNMSQVKWQSDSDNEIRGYGFEYFENGMLKKAQYRSYDKEEGRWANELDWFSVPTIIYDKNGNIAGIQRRGKDLAGGGQDVGFIDDMIYLYSGNQVIGVDDIAMYSSLNDFNDHNMTFQESIEYQYDNNGNLISDNAKALQYQYDRNNMPVYVNLGNHGSISYAYDSQGKKWGKTYLQNGLPPRVTTYVNEFQYTDGQLDFILHEQGRLVATGSFPEFRYEYEYRDHLGNIRMRYSDLNGNGIAEKSEILQENHYYPFGLEILALKGSVNGPEHQHKYNGKELDFEGIDINNDGNLDHYVNHYDYGARLYNAALGRWMGVDPLSEKYGGYSPYNYVINNPIRLIDPDGREPHGYFLGPYETPGTHNNITHETPGNTSVKRSTTSITVNKVTNVYTGDVRSSSINGSFKNISNITNHSAVTISNSMRESEIGEVIVTSTQRSPRRQAEIMYENISKKGIAQQYKLYGKNGDKVIEVYEEKGPDWNCTKEETIGFMTEKIYELGPGNVSRHVSDPSKLNVIDISTHNLGDSGKDFHNALNENQSISKLLTPYNSTDHVFHIEIPQIKNK